MEIGPGSVARYRIREQFARLNFPNDAIGETSEVSGSIVFDNKGAVQAARSKITVNLATLRSDDVDRDEFLATEGPETDRFPLAEFIVAEAPGLAWPLPDDGVAMFQLRGRMTMHGVTSPTTWEVRARFSPDRAVGQARTSFKFDKFGMERPSRSFLLSVENNIRLELDFVASIQPRG